MMEATSELGFSFFLSLIGLIPIVAILFIVISISNSYKKRKKLRPVQFLHYNRSQFDRIFEFKCAYCGQKISNREENCPYCGGSYKDNTEYKDKKKAINLKYLNYLEAQKLKIQQEVDYIEKTVAALRSNIVMKRRFFNFELGEPIKYRPSFNYEFTCDFCGTKMLGHIGENGTCPHCGAGYDDNLDLKVMESEDQLDKLHYDEYVRLKNIEKNQNIENERKDEITTKHAKGIALLVLFGIFVVPGLLIMLVAYLLGIPLESIVNM